LAFTPTTAARSRRVQAFARLRRAVGDRAADLRGDLVGQEGWVGAVYVKRGYDAIQRSMHNF